VDGRGVETTFGRDGVGRVTGKTFTVPDGHPEIPAVSDVTYSFDANGNLTGIANADGSAGWGYDNLDRLQTEQVANGPQISYVYDPRGIITDENVSGYSRLSKTHHHDAVGRRTSTIQDGQTTYFTWDNAGRRKTVTLPNGVVTTYTPDDADRLENIEYKLGGTVFENYAYELDDVGNPEKITTMNGVYEYQYDTAYRLTDETRTGFRPYVAHHEYDSMGNRTSRTVDNVTRIFTYNKADQLTGWTEGTKTGELFYDLDGNNVKKTAKNNGTLTDQWDNEFDAIGRMKTSTQAVGGSQSMTNVYAGDQWYRVEESSNGTTKRFGWRRDELYAEFDANGNLTAGYLNNGVDQPLYKTRFSSNGTVVEGRDFYHQDQNLRVHHVTNSNGAVLEKYVYNGYGKRTILDAQNNEISTTAIGNRIGFQGREHEDLTGDAQEDGLTFHRNRFYSPGLGRWERRDPLMSAGMPSAYHKLLAKKYGLSKYNHYESYESTPIFWIDQTGLYRFYITIVFTEDTVTDAALIWHSSGSFVRDLWDWTGIDDFESETFEIYNKSMDDVVRKIWNAGNWHDPAGLRKDCIYKLIFAGHGAPGSWGLMFGKDILKGTSKNPLFAHTTFIL
jgi:RHS repeat-associated protein